MSSTELQRQTKQALDGLLIPPLQNIVTQYIPIIKLEFWQGWIQYFIDEFGPVMTFKGTNLLNDFNEAVQWTEFREWLHGKQIVLVRPLIETHPPGTICRGDPNNVEFLALLDFRGLVFNPEKCHTIEIDPDLDKILRVIEY
jgi:hypothetical protein